MTVKAADFLRRKLAEHQGTAFADARKSKEYHPALLGIQVGDGSSPAGKQKVGMKIYIYERIQLPAKPSCHHGTRIHFLRQAVMPSTIYDSFPVQSFLHSLRESLLICAFNHFLSLITADKDEAEYIFEMLLEQEETPQYTAFRYHFATHLYILCLYVP